MSGRLLIGTSGYAYAEWRGGFYPEDAGPSDYLACYAREFQAVEINNTFYRFPKAHVLHSWRDQVPEGFEVAVKANQRITHKQKLEDVADVTRDFVERAQELGDRTGPILFQLPPYLRCSIERLDAFLAALPEAQRYAFEVRHRSWFEPEVFDRLRNSRVALCISDDEKLTTPRELTADYAYLRLRREVYTDDQLQEWASFVRITVDAGTDVYVFFKHDEEANTPLPPIDTFRRALDA